MHRAQLTPPLEARPRGFWGFSAPVPVKTTGAADLASSNDYARLRRRSGSDAHEPSHEPAVPRTNTAPGGELGIA